MECNQKNIYYFQVWNDLVLNLVPDVFRELFKQEWKKTYNSEWINGESGNRFFREQPRYLHRDFELRIIRCEDIEMWDISVLLYALCTADPFRSLRCKECRASMQKLRDPRNLLAHCSKGQLSKKEKEAICDQLILIFESLGLETEGIERVKLCDDFVTPRVKELEEKIASYTKGKRSFVVLPPAPGNEAIPRADLVNQAVQTLRELREENPRGVTALHMTGNPGCGKSELARQCGEILAGTKIYDVVMTLNFRNEATAVDSLKEFTNRLGVSNNYVLLLERKSVREQLHLLKSLAAQKLREVYDYWLIIVDNVETSELQEFWPRTVGGDWGSGQMIVSSQNEDLVNEADASVRAMSLKEGLLFSEARQLMMAVSTLTAEDEVFKAIWSLLDKQPLSLTHAALEVFYAKNLSWKSYLDIWRERMTREKPENPPSLVVQSTAYSRSMMDATKGCVKRMCAAEAVWKYAFHFLASCTSDRVPYDLVAEYLMAVPQLKDADEELDEFVLLQKLNSCSLLFIDVVRTPGFAGVEEKTHLAIHTHQVVNKVLADCLLEECDACKADAFTCQRLILTCFKAFIESDKPEKGNAFWAKGPIRSLFQPHILKLFNKLSPLVESLDEDRRELVWDVFLVFSDACYASGHVITSGNLTALCLQLLSKLAKRAHLEGEVQLKLARDLQQQQRPKDALEHAEKAIQLIEIRSDDPKTPSKLSEADLWMSTVLLELGRVQQAEECLRRVLDRVEKAQIERKDYVYFAAMSQMAAVYHRRGLLKESERCYQLVEAKTKEQEIIQYSQTVSNFGWLLCCMRKLNEAIEKLHEGETLFLKLFPADSFHQAYPAINLGIAYRLKGNLEKAEEYSVKAFQLFAKEFGEDNLETGEASDYLGMVYFAQGRFDEARKIHDHSIKLWRQLNGSKHSKFARFLENAGHVARAQRRFSDAEKFYQEAVDNMASLSGADNPETAIFQASLDLVSLDTCRNVEAATTSLLRSFAILSEAYGTSCPLTADCAVHVGYAFLKSGRLSDAKAYFEQALNVFCENPSYGPDSFKIGEVKCWLSKTLLAQGLRGESSQALTEAREIFKKCFGSDHYQYLEIIHLMETFNLNG